MYCSVQVNEMKFMDLLYKKYANPFSLLDGYIQTGRFREFVVFFTKQKREDDRWEFFLHKVYDMTFKDFKEQIKVNSETQNMTAKTIETTINDSLNILGNFTPTE